jgi:hypothetical protein
MSLRVNHHDVIPPFKLCDALPLVNGYASPETNIKIMTEVSYLVTWESNTGTGYFQVEGSMGDATVFASLDLDPIVITGTSGQLLVNLSGLGFERIRLKYVESTSSTGNFSAYVMAKGRVA